ADADSDVSAYQLDVGLADRCHTNEVVGSGEERREGGGKGYLAASCKAGSRSKHILFCNEILKESAGKFLAEFFGVGRILHIGIETDYQGIDSAQSLEGDAECFTRRGGLADLVRGSGQWTDCGGESWSGRWRCDCRCRAIRLQLFGQFVDCFLGLCTLWHRFPMPVRLILHEGNTFALKCLRQKNRRPILGTRRFLKRGDNGGEIVAIHNERVPAEASPAGAIPLHVVLQH